MFKRNGFLQMAEVCVCRICVYRDIALDAIRGLWVINISIVRCEYEYTIERFSTSLCGDAL